MRSEVSLGISQKHLLREAYVTATTVVGDESFACDWLLPWLMHSPIIIELGTANEATP